MHFVLGVQLADLAVTDDALPRTSIVGGASIYPFAQNLLLALRNEGLGASMTTLLVPAEAEVRELLGIPDEVALAAHIGAGHRADPWPKQLVAQTGRRVRLRRALRRAAPRRGLGRVNDGGPELSPGPSAMLVVTAAPYSAGGTGTALNAVVPGATVMPSPVALLAYSSSFGSEPTPLLPGDRRELDGREHAERVARCVHVGAAGVAGMPGVTV